MPVIWDEPREDAPRATTPGRRMWCVPDPPLAGAATEPINPEGCVGCHLRETHDVAERMRWTVPPNVDRYSTIPRVQRPDVDDMHRLQSALALIGYVHHGFPGDELRWNAGEAGDNASQRIGFRVVSASSSEVRLFGPNPRKWLFGRTRLNPSWPLPDPQTGQTSRIISQGVELAAPPCAVAFEPLPPSCLAGKVRVLVSEFNLEGVGDGDEVEFGVRLGGFSASNVTAHRDAAFQSGFQAFVFLRMEALRPSHWKDYQAPPERVFTELEALLETASEHELLDMQNESTRILWPGMAADVFGIEWDPDPPEGFVLAERLATVRDGSGWKTTLDLTGLDMEGRDATVTYWAEWRAGSNPIPGRATRVMGACVHSKTDPTGSYEHQSGRYCARSQNASGFAEGRYHAECWLPGAGCDRFQLLDESPQTMGDGAHLSALHTRANWHVLQTVGGLVHFTFRKGARDGPSIMSLAGGFAAEVYEGTFPAVFEFGGSLLGERVTWTDAAGNHHQQLVHGAWWQRPYDFSSLDGPSYAFDATEEPDGGTVREGEPERMGGTTSLATFATGNSGHARMQQRTEGSEAIAVAMDLDAVDGALAGRLQGVLG